MTDQCKYIPSFFVLGPPRTGTSWLHEVLQTQTRLPKTKETRFFDNHFDRGMAWYRSHFATNGDTPPMGEIAPTYFISQEARERISQIEPPVKAICIFRDPVDRIRSHYRLKRAYAMLPWNFEEALTRDPELMESNRYATHLRAWQDTLGAENVRALLYDDMKRDPQEFVDEIADVIQIPRFQLSPAQIHYVHATRTMTQPRSYYGTRSAWAMAEWCKSHRFGVVVSVLKRTPLRDLFLGGGPGFTEINPELVEHLYELFRPEVEELEAMLGRDLSRWKSDKAQQQVPTQTSAAAQLRMVI